MKYQGSKGRHAKDILPIMLAGRTEGQFFVEPFVGGANVLDKVDGPRIGNDMHAKLIDMWRAVSGGWVPMSAESFSEEWYNVAKKYRNDDFSDTRNIDSGLTNAIIGFTGFALSYGGKWFGGYRRDKDGKRNYADEAVRAAEKQFS